MVEIIDENNKSNNLLKSIKTTTAANDLTNVATPTTFTLQTLKTAFRTSTGWHNRNFNKNNNNILKSVIHALHNTVVGYKRKVIFWCDTRRAHTVWRGKQSNNKDLQLAETCGS